MKVLLGHCPACESTRVYPSRVRNPIEKVRQLLTRKRPFRCHECQWRGWALEAWNPVQSKKNNLEWPPDARGDNPLTPDEFDTLDAHRPPSSRRNPRS